MGRIIKRLAVTTAGAAIAFGVVGTTTAFADMDLYDSGAVHSWRSYSTKAAVEDTKGDSHSVYTRYNRNYPDNDVYTLWNKSGQGTKVWSNEGGRIWDMRACVSLQAEPDSCSDWWTDNHAHG
ncbi:hypothetical protein AB0I49_15790 [Streptomyces sp. NPDC050617]|uniref:hypothetical protein n=1 Tax=Streptomyces sp. NPDC050617 TaxID=3154628 RepID=UPI0034357846